MRRSDSRCVQIVFFSSIVIASCSNGIVAAMEHASTSSSTYTGSAIHAHTTTGRAKRRGVEWSTGKPLEMTPATFAGEGKLVVDVLPVGMTGVSKIIE